MLRQSVTIKYFTIKFEFEKNIWENAQKKDSVDVDRRMVPNL